MKNVIIEKVKEEFNLREYTLLSNEYINQREKLFFICNKHKEKGVQSITYSSFKYKNNGCSFCAREKKNEIERTPLKILEKIAVENNFTFLDIKFSSETKKSNAKVFYVCNKHEYVGVQSCDLSSYKKKKDGCPYCKFVKDTHTLQEKLNDRGFSVEVLGDYIGQKIKILCRCTKHNETFLGAPYKLIQGVFGCKKCKKETIQKNQRITNEEFLERLKSIQPTLKVLEEYVDSTTPLKMYCETHNCYFNESPNTYLYKKKIGCCPEHKHLKSEELFQKELYEKFKGNIVSMEKYQGQDIKINFKCKKHNKIWKTTPIIVLLGKGCPDCVGYSSEIKIFNILKEIGYDFVFQKKFENCRNKRSLIF